MQSPIWSLKKRKGVRLHATIKQVITKEDLKQLSLVVAKRTIKKVFGYDSFREGQEAIIDNLIAGRDGEKSECILYYSAQDIMINRFLIENKSDQRDSGDYYDELSDSSELQKEQDEERLKYMTYYCTTKECLREYMLKYFGEYSNRRCENCGNCQGEFEEVDVTQSCKDMINCIWETKQRFGFLLIFDILLGKETARYETMASRI